MASSVKLPGGFELDSVPNNVPAKATLPGGFELDSTPSAPAEPQLRKTLPGGFELDLPTQTNGDTSAAQPAVGNGSAGQVPADVAPAAGVTALDVAKTTVPGMLLKGAQVATDAAKNVAQAIITPSTGEQSKSQTAIEDMASKPDNSSIIGDLQSGYAADPGKVGVDLLLGHRMYKIASSETDGYGPVWAKAMDNMRRTAAKDIAAKANAPAIAQNPVYQELMKQNENADAVTTLKNYGTALKTEPYGVMRSIALPSLVQSWKSIVGGTIGSIALGNVGASVGAGLGSFESEYNSRIIDGITKYGGDIRNEESILKTIDKYGDQIDAEARKGAAVVAGFDALSGAVSARIARIPTSTIPGKVAQVAGGAVTDAALGSSGAAGAQLAVDGKVSNWDAVMQEALGSIGSGAVMEGGMMAVEKIRHAVSTGDTSSVTEDDLANAWKELVPEEPVSTFTGAMNEGRTYYGFIKDGEAEAEVGSYRDAEAKQGASDPRSGRLIAVREDQTVEAPAPSVRTWANELVFNFGKGHSAEGVKGRDLVADLPNSPFYQITQQLESIRLDMEKGAISQGQAQVLVDELIKPITPNVRVYKGDGFGQRITPRLDNHVLMGNGVYDLDRVQSIAAARGGIVIPAVSVGRLSTMGQIPKLIDQTFNFADDEVRTKFLLGDTFSRAQYMQTGLVSWKGRLDPRFFGNGQFGGSDFVYVDSDGNINDFTTQEMNDSMADNQSLDRFPGFWSNPLSQGGFYEDYRKWIESMGLKNKKEIPLSFSFRPIDEWREKVLHRWLKMLKIDTHIAVVHVAVDKSGHAIVDRDRFRDLLIGKYNIPDSIASDMVAGYDHVSGSRYNAYAHRISGELSLIVVKDYPPGASPANAVHEMETLAHEFGHVVSGVMLSNAPLDEVLEIRAAHRRFREAFDRTKGVGFEARAKTAMNQPGMSPHLLGQGYDYVSSFEEWWAHQATRWALSNSAPLGAVARVARETGRKIVEILKNAKSGPTAMQFRAEPEVEKYLNSLRNGETTAYYSHTLFQELDEKLKQINAKATSTPISQAVSAADNSSAAIRAIVRKTITANSIFSSSITPQVKKNAAAAAATVDRWGWIYKWAANLRQLSEANPHIQELQIARELFGQVKIESAKVHVAADAVLQKWRQLGDKRGKALSQFLFNLDQMTYRTPDEVENGVVRWPTQQEFSDMARDLGIDRETLAVYSEVRDFFLNSVRRIEELRLIDAARIVDPDLRDAAIKSAKQDSIQLLKKPYFPQTRFGKFTLTVRKLDGKVEGFWLFETSREAKNVAADMVKNEYPASDYTVVLSTLPEEVAPFTGMSPWMLDKMREMPGLSQEQLDWIDQLRYHLAPSQSFVKHMMKRKNIIGASEDGRRVFANYAFHHGRNYARTKYGSAFRDVIASLRKSLPAGYAAPEISKRNAMADLVQHQVNELMNPSRDWAHLRALNAIWHLGFNVKSAVVNSTQIFVSTAFLGSKFGGLKAEAAMMDVSARLSTYYRKGSLAALKQTDAEFRAIDRAIRDGHIDESMAAELAALAIGGGVGQRLGKSFFGDKFISGYIAFTEKAMWMQRMTDQWQRRMCFRAAWKLAMENPNNKWLQSLKLKHAMQYETLIRENWTDREALAYLAGMDTAVQTQGTYDRQARPRYMQGRRSVLFAFQLFSQQNLWMLWNNKDMFGRYALYMLALGGMMGLIPDDLENVFELVGKTAFGKDFNLKRGARELVVGMFGDKIPPDLILHGGARYGFGAHTVAEMINAPFVPEVDLSQSIGIGRLVPLDVSRLGAPGLKPADMLATGTENVAGAAYGVPISLMKAVMSDQYDWTDFKRWEGAMPAAFRNLARAWRYAQEGGERTSGGAQTMGFDGDDPEQLGEILGVALGFKPTRQSQQYDRVQAEREIDEFWTLQKQMLLRQAYRDKFVYKDDEAYRETLKQIREYNKRAIAPKYKITGDGLVQSFKSRARATAKIENNTDMPSQVKGMVDKLYPETVEERQVK